MKRLEPPGGGKLRLHDAPRALPSRSTRLLAVLLLIAAGAAAEGSSGSAGCGAEPPLSAGSSKVLELAFDGLQRQFRIHLPPAYDPGVPTSLLLHFHGYTGSALHSEESWSHFSEIGDRENFVVVYPQSTSFRGELYGREVDITSWNDLACNASPGPVGATCADDADPYPCPPECGECGSCNWCSCNDDVGFVRALLDHLEATLCVDRGRVYATGYSNGGMFVHRLGCELADRFAAVAPMHGTLAKGFNCAPSERTSLLVIGGTNDRTVPIDGSRSSDGYFYVPFPDVAAAWAAEQRCTGPARTQTTEWDGTRELACEAYGECQTGAEVVQCSWEGAHDWPLAEGENGPDLFGNELLWSFFERAGEGSPQPPG